MKIAFVYDRVNKFGGAERVLLALHEIWPEAPLFTAVYDPKKAKWADVFKVTPSFLRHISFFQSRHELLPLVTPLAFESFSFDNFDVVLSITSSDAKGIITKPGTLHICYCLTPTRYLWSNYQDYLSEPGFDGMNPVVRLFMKVFFPPLRRWDFIASHRPDFYIAISRTVADRIRIYYRQEAEVIYPPLDIDIFQPARDSTTGSYFLIVARLVPYKRIDYVISTSNKLGWQLKIIGSGIDEKRLKKLAKRNVEFIFGNLTDEKLCWYYQNCQALIFPGEEDFGITALEAQACGKPVVGINCGGISEAVIPGLTGELYNSQNEEALTASLKIFKQKKYLASLCRTNATRFAKKYFQKKMKETIESYWRKQVR